ncbi:hypothetical protein DL239_12230 [Sedimentitalea sp. CY04]|uniref:Ankyrin repeat domain-containing protein n=1 Tax=Parasedimentitalea denitrificans TaxID=2211118 RepID=A0ABX0WA08_9RHOB|nr:ankyrin repeat domain-containing protein [Sedimentitalea sp. CY04]NIZ61738.1 hypothetical protein [Sedimentitalea sp. CY04]
MSRFLLGCVSALAMAASLALADQDCTDLCQASFYQTATVDTVQQMLDQGALVTATDSAGKTPLHWVAQASPDIVDVLIAAGGDVNAKDDLGRSAFHFTSATASPEIVTLFIQAGADVNGRTASDWTPLHGAAKFGSPENIRVLIEAGADASLTNEMGESPFDLATTNARMKDTPEFDVLEEAAKP